MAFTKLSFTSQTYRTSSSHADASLEPMNWNGTCM